MMEVMTFFLNFVDSALQSFIKLRTRDFVSMFRSTSNYGNMVNYIPRFLKLLEPVFLYTSHLQIS